MLFINRGVVVAQERIGTLSPDSIEIYLLTCQPHDEVYSLYGHTSIRIKKVNSSTDIAVNFGVFDFGSDYFVLRFIFGLTDYRMAVYDFNHFLREYEYYGSGVYQQHINMSRAEKQHFLDALYENAKPENVIYRYNFIYNNCTTKARDLILSAFDGDIKYKETFLQKGHRSLRQLIHLKNEDHRWARVGNDLLLGFGADKEMNHKERQFLPEVLMADFDSASVVCHSGISKKLVDSVNWVLLPGEPYHPDSVITWPLSPSHTALLFFFMIMLLCIIERFVQKRIFVWLDYFVILIYGVAGILLGAMIFSKHPAVNVNLQILVLNPLYIIIMFPKFDFKWRWHFMLVSLVLFFVGNTVQTFAEGMNIMALALLAVTLNNLVNIRYGNLDCKK